MSSTRHIYVYLSPSHLRHLKEEHASQINEADYLNSDPIKETSHSSEQNSTDNDEKDQFTETSDRQDDELGIISSCVFDILNYI